MLEVYIYGIWSSVIRNLYHFFRELVPNHVEPFLMVKIYKERRALNY